MGDSDSSRQSMYLQGIIFASFHLCQSGLYLFRHLYLRGQVHDLRHVIQGPRPLGVGRAILLLPIQLFHDRGAAAGRFRVPFAVKAGASCGAIAGSTPCSLLVCHNK